MNDIAPLLFILAIVLPLTSLVWTFIIMLWVAIYKSWKESQYEE